MDEARKPLVKKQNYMMVPWMQEMLEFYLWQTIFWMHPLTKDINVKT